MGRVKLRIKRLESLSNRKVTYSKRRNGLLKKARELSILCDIGICLLMFSPTGKPTLFCGEHSFEDVITKFSQLTPLERAKRKLVCLEALKKTFKKEGHDINVHDFLGPSQQTVEDLSNHVRLLQSQLSEMHRRLSGWSDPEKMNNMEQIRQLEDSLKESLNQINESKENFQKQEPVPLESTSQLQNGMHMPMPMSSIQECLPLSWIPHNENQHMPYYLLSQDPNFFLKREMECSGEASFPGYSGYGSTSGQTEFGNIGQINHTGQGGGALNQFGNAMDMGLEMNEQYPNAFYSHLDFSDENDFKQRAEMNLGGTPLDYQSGCSFKLNEPLYENGQHSSEHCVATMFDENAYPHQPN